MGCKALCVYEVPFHASPEEDSMVRAKKYSNLNEKKSSEHPTSVCRTVSANKQKNKTDQEARSLNKSKRVSEKVSFLCVH